MIVSYVNLAQDCHSRNQGQRYRDAQRRRGAKASLYGQIKRD